MPNEPSAPPSPAAPRRVLNLFDSTCIIVGIIIGAGIYRSTPDIAGFVPGVGWLFTAWILGGLIALVGALCYAELISAYPREGGDYVFLTRAFDRPMGFLFAWSELWIVRPGSIGAMAFAFAEYANRIWPGWTLQAFVDDAGKPRSPSWTEALADPARRLQVAYALAAIVVLSLINMLGVKQGKWTQNILTTCKVLGLLMIVIVGLTHSAVPADVATAPGDEVGHLAGADWSPFDFVVDLAKVNWSHFGLAMIFVMFTYGGWNEMGYVGAEVRNPDKNILRALVLGSVAVTAIYILVNLAFVHAVGFEGTCNATVAADVLKLAFKDWGGQAISLLICISALGVINGQIFTGSRIYYAMGNDHWLFRPLGRWNARFDTPLVSLVVQLIVTVILVATFGFSGNGFNKLVIFTAPAFWFFLLLVGLSLFVFRAREPDAPRPYRVIAYPFTPFVLCCVCLYMLYSAINYAVSQRSEEAFLAIGILLLGVVACATSLAPRSNP